MAASQPEYLLPRHIDRYLAALSKLYGQEGLRESQEIIVNAQVRVQEEWSSDNWNGGTFGHALYLVLPESLYLRVVRRKDDLQSQIKVDLNKIHNVQNEFIEEVFLEMEDAEEHDWRRDSGLLQAPRRLVTSEGARRIWGDAGYRLFLSHKAEIKVQAGDLKTRLIAFGVSCFVAHEDIHPTREWQEEIENALDSMDAFVALMTEDFHDSLWTDQEVGYALARSVPIIAVRLGKDPYGFIGKFQAISSGWQNAPADIAKVLIKKDRMLSAYIQALRKCPSWESSNTLALALPGIEKLTSQQVDELVDVYNSTYELRGGWGFNGSRPGPYGPGLVHYLNLHSDKKFEFGTTGLIEFAR